MYITLIQSSEYFHDIYKVALELYKSAYMSNETYQMCIELKRFIKFILDTFHLYFLLKAMSQEILVG